MSISRIVRGQARRPHAYYDTSTQGESPEVVAVGPDGGAVPVTLSTDTDVIGGTKDAGDAYTPTRTLVSSADISTAVDASAAPTSGQKIVVVDVFISVGATALRVDLLEETSGTVILSGYFPANSGIVQLTPRGLLKLPTADKKLRAQASAAGNVRIVTLCRSEA